MKGKNMGLVRYDIEEGQKVIIVRFRFEEFDELEKRTVFRDGVVFEDWLGEQEIFVFPNDEKFWDGVFEPWINKFEISKKDWDDAEFLHEKTIRAIIEVIPAKRSSLVVPELDLDIEREER